MIRRIFISLVLVLVAAFGLIAWWINQPLMRQANAAATELGVEAGASVRSTATLAAKVTGANGLLLYTWLRLATLAAGVTSKFNAMPHQIKAGTYAIEPSLTPLGLYRKLLAGDEIMLALTIPEGWTFKQMRAAVDAAASLKHTTAQVSDEQLMATLGKSGVLPEGRFFPDTYRYAKNASDITIYKQASAMLDKRLQAAWDGRSKDTPLKTPDELLTLASIVEKETGKPSDRAEIAGVFINRLRLGMLLQTDPTVIYGMGERFAQQRGNIRRADLLRDTPYNTYTRSGLPPSPIALVGSASLGAASQPKATDALYFVARGDGSSQFSATLAQHNAAVNTFIRGKK